MKTLLTSHALRLYDQKADTRTRRHFYFAKIAFVVTFFEKEIGMKYVAKLVMACALFGSVAHANDKEIIEKSVQILRDSEDQGVKPDQAMGSESEEVKESVRNLNAFGLKSTDLQKLDNGAYAIVKPTSKARSARYNWIRNAACEYKWQGWGCYQHVGYSCARTNPIPCTTGN